MTNVEHFAGAFGYDSVNPCAQFELLDDGDLAVAGSVLARVKPSGVVNPAFPAQPMLGLQRFRAHDLLESSDGTLVVMLVNYHTAESATTYLARYRQVEEPG